MAAEWRVSRRSGTEVSYCEMIVIMTLHSRGVFSGKDFGIGEFLFEYRGSLKQKEAEVNIDDTYVYEIDSTEENGSLGRMANDNHIKPNCRPKIHSIDGKPHLLFFAIRNIRKDDEIQYNYGGVSYPWRHKMLAMENDITDNNTKLSKRRTTDTSNMFRGKKKKNMKKQNFLDKQEKQKKASSNASLEAKIGFVVLFYVAFRPSALCRLRLKEEVEQAKKSGPVIVLSGCSGIFGQIKVVTDLVRFIKMSKGHLTSTWEDATHIIVVGDEERCTDATTLKLFHAILDDRHIIDIRWIHDSLKQNCVLPEAEYRILGDNQFGKWPAERKRVWSFSCPFAVCKLQDITREKTISIYAFVVGEMEDLINKMGGKISKQPDFDNCILIGDSQFSYDQHEYSGKVMVDKQWIFDCILSDKLMDKDSYLVNCTCNDSRSVWLFMKLKMSSFLRVSGFYSFISVPDAIFTMTVKDIDYLCKFRAVCGFSLFLTVFEMLFLYSDIFKISTGPMAQGQEIVTRASEN
ncbi:hypothetical protein KUTeg_013415 [Tegillarca granosa]|uniref:BRCT domain-containing protein n=1 Tax=Tegillarca granosa TaxID=220873 RepID=A0ABQ9ETM0_TEGGR|nr:hypothetical protein KUTeg_013415 [Tegillarca granosa]